MKHEVEKPVQTVKTSAPREGKPNGALEQDESASHKAVIRKLGPALLVAVDARTYLADMTRLVFPELRDVLKELPIGATPDEVQLGLAALVDYGLLGTNTYKCCGTVTYFRICGAGCPLILHDLH